MIVDAQNAVVDYVFQFLQIEDHTGYRVGIAFDRNLHHIVMTVPLRIGGQAVNPFVFSV
jgi:hypothetical protein